MNVVNSNKMNKPFDFITSSFAANLSDTYSISIRQLPDGYNFYITNDKNESVAIKHISAEHITPALLTNEPLLQLNYRSATYIGHGVFSMIPQNLIIDNNYTAFLPIENNLRLRAKTIANPINSDTIIACYTNQWTIPFTDTRHKTQDTRTLNNICKKHHEIELLTLMALQASDTDSMWAEITTQNINIVVIKNRKLHLVNTYPITCDNDAAYYILACYQQLELSQEDTPLNILGNITTINPLPFLKDYIRHIEIQKPKNWNPEFPNEYSTLFTLQSFNLI